MPVTRDGFKGVCDGTRCFALSIFLSAPGFPSRKLANGHGWRAMVADAVAFEPVCPVLFENNGKRLQTPTYRACVLALARNFCGMPRLLQMLESETFLRLVR